MQQPTQNTGFNSKMVRLKDRDELAERITKGSFNSKMVRLKAFIACHRDSIKPGFNSKMVRLKDLKVKKKATP